MFGSTLVFVGILFIILALLLAYYSPDTEIGLGPINGPAWIVFIVIAIILFVAGGALNQFQNWVESLFST